MSQIGFFSNLRLEESLFRYLNLKNCQNGDIFFLKTVSNKTKIGPKQKLINLISALQSIFDAKFILEI